MLTKREALSIKKRMNHSELIKIKLKEQACQSILKK
jgi:hypothetical protein